MPRFARASDSNRKRPQDATEWNEMKKDDRNGERTLQKKLKQNDSELRNKKDKRKKEKQNNVSQSSSQDEVMCQQTTGSMESRLRSLSQETVQESQLKAVYKKVKRSEDRRLKRIHKREDEMVCYNCRESGHLMSDCPEVKRDVEQGTGICFKCGSTEHSSSKCSVRLPPGKFPYAKCFICGETGHLSKQCPDNPKGLYPMGGCCKICESVEHYQRDCPELQNQQGVKSYCLPTIAAHTSVDAEVDLEELNPKPAAKKKKGPKTVVF
ncbi:zinc finger CCHC domain-containing protein 9-like [Ostrea edulis]|uniref:zinc finger CCHC domain-containing protein 9-like n=1 Tax=Ostrea edulis TaxID=37623 RepID=UPI0020952FBA|nr:zinc finger CCHC domain-containing protein 9-like [Ostrea edulis]